MKNIINQNHVLNGLKIAAAAIIFQVVVATSPVTASHTAALQAPLVAEAHG